MAKSKSDEATSIETIEQRRAEATEALQRLATAIYSAGVPIPTAVTDALESLRRILKLEPETNPVDLD